MKFSIVLFSLGWVLASMGTLLPENGLQAHFRADDPSSLLVSGTTPHLSRIKQWRHSGNANIPLFAPTIGSEPYFMEHAFGSHLPGLRFNWKEDGTGSFSGYQCLRSQEQTDLGITSESTWFLISTFHQTQIGHRIFGICTDDGNIANRFGAFFLGHQVSNQVDGVWQVHNHSLRLHNGNNPRDAGTVDPPVMETVLLGSRLLNGVGQTITMQGVTKRALPGISNGTPTAGIFSIGEMLTLTGPRGKMDVGDLVIYNRALNDAEMEIAQTSLLRKYNRPLPSTYAYQGTGSGPNQEIIGIGCRLQKMDAGIPGSAQISGWSKDLQIESLQNSFATDGEFLFATRMGTEGWTGDTALNLRRSRHFWRFERHSPDTMQIRIRFRYTGIPQFSGGLLYRTSASAPYSILPVNGTYDVETSTVSFDLSDELIQNGDYAIALYDGTLQNIALTYWLRADQGVETNEAGKVVCWKNFGSLGSACDMYASSGTVTRTMEKVRPALSFPGDAMLRSQEASSYGIHAISNGATIFIVYNPTNFTYKSESGRDVGYCLFGSDSGWPRFGIFFPTKEETLRTFAWSQNYISEPTVMNQNQLFGCRSSFFEENDSDGNNILHGSHQNQISRPFLDKNLKPAYTPIKVGHFHNDSWLIDNEMFRGEISEIRVYNRDLNDAEYNLKMLQLMLWHQISPSTEKRSRVNARFFTFSSTETNLLHDLCAAGFLHDGVRPGRINDIMESGGLWISFPNEENLADDFLLFSHNAETLTWTTENETQRLQRFWRLIRIPGNSESVTLHFPAPKKSAGSWNLLYRNTLEAPWGVLPAHAIQQNGNTAFTLPASALKDGFYTVGLGETAAEPTYNTPPSAGISTGLRYWYRAEDGVSGSLWKNFGYAGPDGDLTITEGQPTWNAQGFQRGTELFTPSVTFTGDDSYTSLTNLTFGEASEITWFAVFRTQNSVTTDLADMGVWGNKTTSLGIRLGAFFIGGSPYPLRFYGSSYHTANVFQSTSGGGDFLNKSTITDFRQQMRRANIWHNGTTNQYKTLLSEPIPLNDKIFIGRCLNVKRFIGEFAELRIYDRALNNIERDIVRNHLAAKYGVTLEQDANTFPGATSEMGDHDLDLAGIGITSYSVADTLVSGKVLESESSGGLFLTSRTNTGSHHALLAHNTASNEWLGNGRDLTMKRSWYLASSGGLSATLRFSFDKAKITPRPQREKPIYSLLWKSTPEAEWINTGIIGTQTDTDLLFDISAGELSDGIFTFCAEIIPPGTLFIVR